jgi:hypothetical protein
MLFVIEKQLAVYRQRIEELFARHPDHELFGSLPGAGPKIAPRLLSEIGDDHERFDRDARGGFLLDVGARAFGSPGSLSTTLAGSLLNDRDRAEAGRLPTLFSSAAELFTTSLCLARVGRSARS